MAKMGLMTEQATRRLAIAGAMIERLAAEHFTGCLELHFGGGTIGAVKRIEHFPAEQLEPEASAECPARGLAGVHSP